jgi:hypothetical protein
MKKNVRIFAISVFFIILIPLLFFLGLKIWIKQQYNKDGNLLLIAYPDPLILYEITKSKMVVWEYYLSKQGEWRGGYQMIYATRFKNGNTLIFDPGAANNKIYEINRSKEIVWRCDELKKDDTLVSHFSGPTSAQRLPNGNTLITGDSSVIEVTGDCRIIWEHICVQNDSFAYPSTAFKFPDNKIGILVFVHSGLEYWEVDYSSNQVVKKIDLEKYTTSSAVILPNKHILVAAIPFIGAKNPIAIELDTLTNIVWRFEPGEDIFDLRKNRWGDEIKPYAFNVYPTSKMNFFIDYLNCGTIEVTPSKEVVWKLEDDESLRDILGIKFFGKRLNDSLYRTYEVAGIVQY